MYSNSTWRKPDQVEQLRPYLIEFWTDPPAQGWRLHNLCGYLFHCLIILIVKLTNKDFSYICIEVPKFQLGPFPLNLSLERARFFSITFTSTHQYWLIRDLWASSSTGWEVPAYSPHLRSFSRFPAVRPYLCCSTKHDRALDAASSSSTCWQCSAWHGCWQPLLQGPDAVQLLLTRTSKPFSAKLLSSWLKSPGVGHCSAQCRT